MKRKGGWRVGHASQESRKGSRELAMQLGMLGKERRIKFSALTESALVIPQGDLLCHAVELLLLANPRGTLGQLMETAVGLNSSRRLELTVPLSDEDGKTWMALLIPDRAESPQWEQGSHNEEGF